MEKKSVNDDDDDKLFELDKETGVYPTNDNFNNDECTENIKCLINSSDLIEDFLRHEVQVEYLVKNVEEKKF